MKQLQYILSLAAVILITSCTAKHTLKPEAKLVDTVYTSKAAMDVFDYNPERAMIIIDSAEIVGNLTHDRAMYFRAKIITMTLEGLPLDSAQNICLALMQSNYVKDDNNLESVLDLLVNISRRKQDFEQWLKWSTMKADLCRNRGDEVEALRTEAEIGVILAYLDRLEDGLQTLDEVIERLDGTRKFNQMDACIIALRRKVDVLQHYNMFDEIIPVAHKIIEKTNDYEQNPDDFHDGSFREPNAARLSDYCEFYRVKAYAYLARSYAETDDITEARHYLKLFEQSRYGQTFDGRMMISKTWFKLGDYDKMLAIYDEVEKYLDDDTINETFSMILYDRGVAAEANGQYTLAYNYMKRHAELNQMISEQLQNSKAQEYAARYRAKEQQLEIDRFTMQNRMQNIIILIIFIALLFTVILYNHTVVQKRELAKKNIALSKFIDNNSEKNNNNRLSKACKLLREHPEMTIADVAKEAGVSPRNLNKLFREQYGISPTEYKKSHQK